MADQDNLFHQQTIMISELLIKVTALQNVMESKGLISNSDIATETKKVVSKLEELIKLNIEKPATNN